MSNDVIVPRRSDSEGQQRQPQRQEGQESLCRRVRGRAGHRQRRVRGLGPKVGGGRRRAVCGAIEPPSGGGGDCSAVRGHDRWQGGVTVGEGEGEGGGVPSLPPPHHIGVSRELVVTSLWSTRSKSGSQRPDWQNTVRNFSFHCSSNPKIKPS